MNKINEEDVQYIVSNKSIDWERFRNKSVLITGANGFIPSYMVDVLMYLNQTQDLNCQVIAIVRNGDKAHIRFKNYWQNNQFGTIFRDVCNCTLDIPFINHLKADFIIHAASQASPKYFKSDPIGTIKANTIGTFNMMELAHQKQSESVLFMSSGAVYGTVEMPFQETKFGYIDPYELSACYASSKHCGEVICESYFHQYQTPVKIVRPMHIYGPGLSLDDGRGFVDFVNNVLHNQDIELHSTGSDTRDFMYITDAIILMFQILLNGKNGDAYNCGTGIETSILQLATTLCDLYPEKGLSVKFDLGKGYRTLPNHRSCADMLKCMVEFNFDYKYNIKEGFKRMIDSYELKE